MTRNATAISVGLDPSGKTPVTGSFGETGSSGNFTPIAGRPFNVTLWDDAGTFGGLIILKRSFDNGATWHELTAAGDTLYSYSEGMSEIIEEYEVSVKYKLECTVWVSGEMNYRISQ